MSSGLQFGSMLGAVGNNLGESGLSASASTGVAASMTSSTPPLSSNASGVQKFVGTTASGTTMGRITVPRLDALASRALAMEYHNYPALDEIPPEYLDNVISMLDPSKIDFVVACNHVTTEKFWRRLAIERWSILDPKKHGNSWKRLFVERHLGELLESYYPSKDNTNFTQLLEQVEAARHFTHSLSIKQLLSNLDIAKALGGLPHLTRLELCYTTKNLGMDYDRSLFGLQLPGAMTLARLIAHSTTLTHVTIRESRIGDEACHVIARGLADNDTITHIDFAHNKIGDLGAAYLARAFAVHPVLTHANLSNNAIGSGGARAIATALRSRSESLESLDLSLNMIGDDAGAELLESLIGCNSLTKLSLSACALGPESARALALLIQKNPNIEFIDVSCNVDLLKAPAPSLLAAANSSGSTNSSGGANPNGSPSAATSSNLVTGLSTSSAAQSVAAAHQASQALLAAIQATESGSTKGSSGDVPEVDSKDTLSVSSIPSRLISLDLRRTKVTDKVAQQIEAILGQRRAQYKQALRKAFQDGWDTAE